MLDLQSGDRIEIFYPEAPDMKLRAIVDRLRTDREEGMGVAVEEYAVRWIEITLEEPCQTEPKQVVLLGTDFQYRLNGRTVTLRRRQD